MNIDEEEIDDLIRRATAGVESAMAELFHRHRDRLRRMVRLRLDPRLQGRVDPSDILQDAYVDLVEKLPDYKNRPGPPFLVWLRLVVGERLIRVHRHHLGTAARDAGREISLHQASMPQASSASLAAHLLGRITTASQAAARNELQHLLQEALNGMEPIDREVIALRHFEDMSNDDVAAALGLSKAAASKRYVRAMVRLKRIVDSTPNLADPSLEQRET